MNQLGGDPERLLEIDVLRGPDHDMLRDDGPYRGLLRAALEGRLKGIVVSPNCRTRSVLRHYPVEGREEYPKPVRHTSMATGVPGHGGQVRGRGKEIEVHPKVLNGRPEFTKTQYARGGVMVGYGRMG